MPQDKRAPLARAVSGQQAPHDSTPLASGPAAGLPVETPLTEESGRILSVLSSGEIELKGRIPWSSNATFLVSVCAAPPAEGAAGPGEDLLAIYKPTSGERPLWDFPRGLWKREVAAYELCSFMGWDIVPPTTARPDGPLGPGSLQFCVDTAPDEHFFTLVDDPQHHRALRRIAAFDLVANNADRKSGHCLLDQAGHIWAIDHGLCFHTDPKLRTVIWDFAGEKVDQDLLAPLEMLALAEMPRSLESLLSEEEIEAVSARARAALSHRRYPKPRGDFPYPWPLV
ncbi:MAG TPA: SCO1664 family protein [Acidimicrobiales bacterium]|nr:SCO1664 family protein [Acidimicrobiales bacterium]